MMSASHGLLGKHEHAVVFKWIRNTHRHKLVLGTYAICLDDCSATRLNVGRENKFKNTGDDVLLMIVC